MCQESKKFGNRCLVYEYHLKSVRKFYTFLKNVQRFLVKLQKLYNSLPEYPFMILCVCSHNNHTLAKQKCIFLNSLQIFIINSDWIQQISTWFPLFVISRFSLTSKTFIKSLLQMFQYFITNEKFHSPWSLPASKPSKLSS